MSDSAVQKRYLERMFVPPLLMMVIVAAFLAVKWKSLSMIGAALVVTVPLSSFWVLFVYVFYLVFGRRARSGAL